MTLTLRKDDVALDVDFNGITVGTDLVGSDSALLHLSKRKPHTPMPPLTEDALDSDKVIQVKATVKLDSTDRNKDLAEIGLWEFGFIQVADIMNYEYRYAGRTKNEGSMIFDLRQGFTQNPSLDHRHPVFSESHLSFFNPDTDTRQSPFSVTLSYGDNPYSFIPLGTENRSVKNARNYLYFATRDEGFVTYLFARDPQKKIHFLARVGWHIIWRCNFNWTSDKQKPTVIPLQHMFQRGEVRIGPPQDVDPSFALAKDPKGKTTKQLEESVIQHFNARNEEDSTIVKNSKTWPSDLPKGFFGSK
jgi:hypothetical protein